MMPPVFRSTSRTSSSFSSSFARHRSPTSATTMMSKAIPTTSQRTQSFTACLHYHLDNEPHAVALWTPPGRSEQQPSVAVWAGMLEEHEPAFVLVACPDGIIHHGAT